MANGSGNLAGTIAKILSQTNTSKKSSAKDYLKSMLKDPQFRQWFLANDQAIINASEKGTTRVDSLILAVVAYRLRAKHSVGWVGEQLSLGLERTGGWKGAINRIAPGMGQVLGGPRLKGYIPEVYATTGGGQQPGAPAGLSRHQFATFQGQVNTVYEQWLGRKATEKEAMKVYQSGISWKTLQQQLIMSKEFVGTAQFKKAADYYKLVLGKFMGGNYQIHNQQIQSFLAHGYQQGDVQAWIYAHPHIYRQSNEFQQNKAALVDQYIQIYGYDPTQGTAGTVSKKVRVKTGKVGKKGHPFFKTVTKQVEKPNATMEMINQAAQHFQSPDQFAAFLRRQPQYKSSLEYNRGNPQQNKAAGTSINTFGRPVVGGQSGADTTADIGR